MPSINRNPGSTDFAGPDLWSGQKFVEVGKPPTILIRTSPLRRPMVLTVDLQSDPVNTGVYQGQRSCIFDLSIGIGRQTILKRVGASQYIQSLAAINVFPIPLVKQARLNILAQTLIVKATADPAVTPGERWEVIASAGIGAAIPAIYQESQYYSALETSIAQTAINTIIVPSQIGTATQRRGLLVRNDSLNNLFLSMGGVASTASPIRIIPGERWEMPYPFYQGFILGTWDAAGAGFARVLEQLTGGVF